MSPRLPWTSLLLVALVAGCAAAPGPGPSAAAAPVAAQRPSPPVAAQRPHAVVAPHGATRQDEYYWLRDDAREDPEVLAYLAAENRHADAWLQPLAALEQTLYYEIAGRLPADESSVPYRDKGYWYYARYRPGADYPVQARRRGEMTAPEQVLLDIDALARGKDYYDVGDWQVSPDQRLLAYAEDSVGRNQYELRVRDLDSGRDLPDRIAGIAPNLMWGDDNRTLYYVENDPTTLLGRRVKAHVLGTPAAADRLVYEEGDESFFLWLGRTRSERYLCIGAGSTVSTEYRCAEAAGPGPFRVLAPRQRDVEYEADHLGGRWVIRTNWQAPNYRLMTLDDDAPWGDRGQWQALLAHDDDVLVTGFDLFDGFLAISERSEGLQRLRIRHADGRETRVPADEAAYAMATDGNAEPGSDWLRYTYTSLATPTRTFELHVGTGERRLLREQPVLGGFDRTRYATERLWAPARDGARVPVTVLYRRGQARDGRAALYLYGYGAYGLASDPEFDPDVFSLVDRGVVYAIAHVRGGNEMGRAWYDAGRLRRKGNSFTDFIDAGDFLVAQGWAARDRVAAAGASAGGLLIGAVANLAPEKYRVIVAHVPFVDLVTTMLDDSIPLTTNEFDEWGDPGDPADYAHMLSYSPYDQVRRQAYPAMLVTTGLWDSQVQYFEPAKWVARLRARKTDDNPLLLRTHLQAGHQGRSGRFQRHRQRAEEYAFVLDRLGLAR